MTEPAARVHLAFGRCDASIVTRAVVAASDQLCSTVDMSLDLLDALEYPLSECIGALHPSRIHRVTVSTHDHTLVVEFGMETSIGPRPVDVLGGAHDAVAAFFEITCASDATTLSLEGSLG